MPADEIVATGITIKYIIENKSETMPGAINLTNERLKSYLAECLSTEDFGDVIILVLHFIQKHLFKRKIYAVHMNRTKASKRSVVKA